MAMDPLASLLGNYRSDEEDVDDDDDGTVAPAAAPIPTARVAAIPEALPDADSLLDGVESSWKYGSGAEEALPKRDSAGTSYNSVALPDALAKESVNVLRPGAAARKTAAACKVGLAASSAAKKQTLGGALLPPQLQQKRPNQSTEDLAGMRSHSAGGPGGVKRSKGGGSS